MNDSELMAGVLMADSYKEPIINGNNRYVSVKDLKPVGVHEGTAWFFSTGTDPEGASFGRDVLIRTRVDGEQIDGHEYKYAQIDKVYEDLVGTKLLEDYVWALNTAKELGYIK